MKEIKKVFKEVDSALIPYICAGDPDLKTTRELIFTLERAGADIIELGIPFSDPLADGPVIQEAGQRALEAGADLEKIIELTDDVSSELETPLVLMGYYNSISNYGRERFVRDLERAGAAGVIVPDLPYDEDPDFYENLRECGVSGILLAAPNTNSSRLNYLGEKSAGFLYCVSLLGVTGNKKGPFEKLEQYIEKVRGEVELPLALGFGIDGPEKAAAVSEYVEGVIMGSAIIEVINGYSEDKDKMHRKVEAFVTSIKRAIQG